MRSVPRDLLAPARFALVGTPSVRHTARRFSTDSGTGAVGGDGGALDAAAQAPLTAAFGSFSRCSAMPSAGRSWRAGAAGDRRRIAGRGSWRPAAWSIPGSGGVRGDLAALAPRRITLLDTSPRGPASLWPGRDRLPARKAGRRAAPVPVRAGDIQGRLGARRSGAVDRRGMPSHGDGASRRYFEEVGAASEAAMAARVRPPSGRLNPGAALSR